MRRIVCSLVTMFILLLAELNNFIQHYRIWSAEELIS